ncbi:prolyl aminopeptidase [Ureaplasma miroungigenitalium]|uniref:prolyl aminopeptidase n=1 Tax=Ureaplasma miroungigenitalium TaxID=1042321 RepID=UPI0021E98A2B|nr:prolyl aminopeptidase [Ureaplasma miroungigenitalium]MCV3734105.1 prolyl aminopeptidase [Ureaplasma miroungigenitalium]
MSYQKYLYPQTKPFFTGYLNTPDNHQIYYELSGNQQGIPIVFIHGGPGGGTPKNAHRFFDPTKYFVITFDQRGCGRSRPLHGLKNNTTMHLVNDMVLLKKTLKIDQWILFGGSWGTTLALVYAIHHTQDVISIVLRGVFLARASSVEWLYQDGASFMRPTEYANFVANFSAHERANVIQTYYKLLNHPDQQIALKAAYQWNDWETSLVSVNKLKITNRNDEQELAIAKLENYYFYHQSFLEEDFILKNCESIKNIPTYIVHGLYDLDCRPVDAYDLHQKLNNSQLFLVPKAGHTTRDTNLMKAVMHVLNDLIK